ADLETPVTAYLKVAQGPYSFLLESVEGGERLARYSFIGSDPYLVVRMSDGTLTATHQRGDKQVFPFTDPLEALQGFLTPYTPVRAPGMDLPRFLGGAVGYLGYECIRYFEPRVPMAAEDVLHLPDAVFMLTDTLLVFDHLRRRIKVVSHVHPPRGYPDTGDLAVAYDEAVARINRLVGKLRDGSVTPPRGTGTKGASGPIGNFSRAEYETAVERAKEYIAAGDIIQCVPSQRLTVPTSAAPFTIYRALRAINPSPYMVYFNLDGFQIVASSPESLVRNEGGTITTHPLAGTRPRGKTEEDDRALAEELSTDEKERAEHIMLVDLGRNDIGRIATPGTVRVPSLMQVERYSHVMHLCSEVEGQLKPEYTSLDALRACFPMGTASGAPKIRAMEIIAQLEHERRGPYAGALGYVGYDGNMDFALALRTMPVKDGVAYPQAGGGVVADSSPEAEYHECHHKMGALLRAIETAEAMEEDEG
ncbi:MAG TPA: anthranilate synthase component I, partial [Thermomicrobiales bacterium]